MSVFIRKQRGPLAPFFMPMLFYSKMANGCDVWTQNG